MPAVSIVVPVFKAEKYISDCIESILNQTYTDFQLILVDDGSPDSSGAVCDAYADKDDRIVVIHQNNSGPGGARNTGIEYILNNHISEWVTFIDSDDWVKPCYLEYLYEAAQKSGARISICNALFVNSRLPLEENQDQCTWAVFDSVTAYTDRYESCVVATGKLFHISLLKTERFPIGKIHEDAFLIYKLVFSAGRVAIIDPPLYYYFNNTAGITHSNWSPARLDEIDAHEGQLSFLKSHNYPDAYAREADQYVHILACQLQSIGPASEYAAYRRLVKAKLKKAIRLYRRTNSRKIEDIAWIYELGYPVFMRGYWALMNIRRKFD